mmetsp:Transcript_12350/g.28996  ORF Transcript_12350/g.28996 Transcript_12350/m.28996 type:complete len:319 (-) Transcript_12350:28-984(-)
MPHLVRCCPALVAVAMLQLGTGAAVVAGPGKGKEIAPGVMMPYLNAGKGNRGIWVKVGGRGLDTAFAYGDIDQNQTGDVLRSSGLPRSELFLTTKVPCCDAASIGREEQLCRGRGPETAGFLAHDLELLEVDYVDVMLLHWPCASLESTLTAWKDIEDFYRAGKARAIGVSNFNASFLDRFLPHVSVRPVVNQVGFSIGGHSDVESYDGRDDVTLAKCHDLGVTLTAYSPLGNITKINVLKDPTVTAVSKAHNKSNAQVALRWLIQQGIPLITATNSEAHAVSDLEVFDFELSPDEMTLLAAVHPDDVQQQPPRIVQV